MGDDTDVVPGIPPEVNGAPEETPDEAEEQDYDTEETAAPKSAAERRRIMRRKKKKEKAKERKALAASGADVSDGKPEKPAAAQPPAPKEAPTEPPIQIEYVIAKPDISEALQLAVGDLEGDAADEAAASTREAVEELARVFEKFSSAEALFGTTGDESKADGEGGAKEEGKDDKDKGSSSDDSGSSDEEGGKDDEASKLSKKKKKMLKRLKVAELKQNCPRPEVVEIWDTTAADPRLLVHLKACRNTVPVPRHWSQKRKYLQGKRGIEKIPFQLPDFIAATGIEKIRQAYVEKEDQKKMKQKQREKMQPKMNKMDIDYQVLHDAFFRFQTKPKLTEHGDAYYEGKEFEPVMVKKTPGEISEELRAALGMPEGHPPPWLINMQRYGPPPAYPALKIPGLNAPIPEGASFGYHVGGWGKPPVDEFGRPLYGDVFAAGDDEDDQKQAVDKEPWGELHESEEEEEEEESEEEEEDELGEDEMAAGMASVDSMSSMPSGVQTPDVIDLRKAGRKEGEDEAPPPLFHVLETRESHVGEGDLMGTAHTYVVPGAKKAAAAAGAAAGAPAKDKAREKDRVDITLRPEELEGLDDTQLASKYKAARTAEMAAQQQEKSALDFSDMVAEDAAKRKRKAMQKDKDAKSKKLKDFKF
eukprot:jgi/Mesvir1/28640/Mv15065-RA.1